MSEVSLNELELFILERLHKRIYDYTFEERSEGVHVSSLAFPCLRSAYFDQTVKEKPFSMRACLRMWLGKVAHTTSLLKNHELEIKWDGDGSGVPIVGTVDEYDQDLGLVREKKSIRRLPSAVLPHHEKQLLYYAVILTELGKPVRNLAWIYFTLSPVEFNVFSSNYDITKHSEIKAELLDRKRKLMVALERGWIPKREGMKEPWICNYCSWWSHCMGLED